MAPPIWLCTLNSSLPHSAQVYLYLRGINLSCHYLFPLSVPRNGPLGSVVCTFTFGTQGNDLEKVFRGKYVEEVGQNQFVIRDNFDPFTVSGKWLLSYACGNE